MDRIVKGVGAVVHLAGPASVRESLEKPGDYFRVHVDGTATILEASRRAGILRFVYISSAEVYGRPVDSPVSEDYALQPRSPYGAAKVGAEFAVRAYVASFGMTAVILRPFSIYGPGSAVESLFGTIERQLRTSNNVELADLRPVRDYCYVGDLADATVRAIGSPLTGLTIINIGTGEGTSVSALAMLAAGVLNRRVTVSEDATARRAPATEIFELVADPRKAAEILGWTAKTPLADGLALTLRGGDVRRA